MEDINRDPAAFPQRRNLFRKMTRQIAPVCGHVESLRDLAGSVSRIVPHALGIPQLALGHPDITAF